MQSETVPEPKSNIPANRVRPVMTTGLDSDGKRLEYGRWPQDFQKEASRSAKKLVREFVAGPDGVEEQSLEKLRDRVEMPNKKAVLGFIKNLGIDLDLDAAEQRLDHTQLVLYERGSLYDLVQLKGRGRESVASYGAIFRIANAEVGNKDRISVDESQAIRHELFHAASGQIATAKGKHVANLAVGLSRTAHYNSKKTKEEVSFNGYDWLNEGVTEILTEMLEQKLFEEDALPIDAYPEEVALVQKLSEIGGIPLNTFFEAYFEEPDLDAKPGQRMPKWHKLQAELRTAFGPRFLQTLDKWVQEFGIYGLLMNDGLTLKTRKHEWGQAKESASYKKGKDKFRDSKFYHRRYSRL